MNSQLSLFSELKIKETVVCWFSCGVTSAVSIKKALDKYRDIYNFEIYYCHINSAHSDNKRFLKECENWFKHKIITIHNKKGYKDQFDVIEKTRFINGVGGARCTLELKKSIRYDIEKSFENDYSKIIKYQVLGYEFSKKEINRAIRFIEQNPKSKAIFPLIENYLSKKECMKILLNTGIELPKMYSLGYSNNNCIGCVKGGKGYWNKIKIDFPEVFEKMVQAENNLNHSCIKNTFLRDLKESKKQYKNIDIPDCSNFCEVELSDIESKNLDFVLNKVKNISDYYLY